MACCYALPPGCLRNSASKVMPRPSQSLWDVPPELVASLHAIHDSGSARAVRSEVRKTLACCCALPPGCLRNSASKVTPRPSQSLWDVPPELVSGTCHPNRSLDAINTSGTTRLPKTGLRIRLHDPNVSIANRIAVVLQIDWARFWSNGHGGGGRIAVVG
jgi:hypothetical protein